MIPIARGDTPYASIEELRRRAEIPVTALERLAEADAFGSLGMNRRDALWTIRGLSDEVMPLFAAADERDRVIRSESVEPIVELTPMTEGREVVEDYRSKGLTLRQHPLAFLRGELRERRIHSCATLRRVRDGQWLTIAGMVLVRQKPSSAKGVMFMTIEDETDVANIIVWPSLFEKQRRLILSSGMIGVRGRFQREGGVTHLIAKHLIDLTDLLRSVGDRDDPFSSATGAVTRPRSAPAIACARAQGRSSSRRRLNCRSNQPRCRSFVLRHGISIDGSWKYLIFLSFSRNKAKAGLSGIPPKRNFPCAPAFDIFPGRRRRC
jgi:error-prone DNA polymerase